LKVIIELQSLIGGSKTVDIEIPAGEIDLEADGARLSQNVVLNADVRSSSGITAVEGTIDTAADVACTRCLERITVPLTFSFVTRFVAAESFGTSGERELHGEDLDYDTIEAERIDLTDVVREQLLLNLPQQVLCKEDCRGLCEKCGANRNLIDCKCENDELDPRWAALQNLK
jgi:uncharacterized protein